VIGGLGLSFPAERSFSDEERRLMLALAHQCAQAIERARLYEAEARARQEAERANELRLRFLAMISHELRTPLASIKGFASTLLAKDVDWDADAQQDFLATIDQEADKLTDMIDQILDLSRIETGTLRINLSEQDFGDILMSAMPQLYRIAENHPLAINIPAGLPSVRADRQRITQVLANLVANAAKFSPPGSDIRIEAERTVGGIQVSVSDHGIGIPPQDRPYVFEAFRRGSEGRVRYSKGAGLGLAICRGLIEAHGGQIWVSDQSGPGTTVSFTLPVADA
jgi:signal transduction histidine kinase